MSKALQGLCWLAGLAILSMRAAFGEVPLLTFQKVGTWPKFDHGVILSVAIENGRLYAAAERGGLIIAEMANPLAPTIIGGTTTDAYARGIAVDRNIAYVLTDGGLRCFDASDAASPRLVFSDNRAVRGVFGRDGFAYVAVDASFEIYDSHNGTPTRIAALPMPGSANGVALNGDIAYVAAGAAGLVAINVAKPDAPVRLGSVSLGVDALNVAATETNAYVATGLDGFRVVDVANPSQPALVGHYAVDRATTNVSAQGNIVFLGGYLRNLEVIDVSDPKNPRLLSRLIANGGIETVTPVGNLAYAAGIMSFVSIWDMTNPAAPIRVGELGPDSEPGFTAVKIHKNKAVTLTAGTLQVFDFVGLDEPKPGVRLRIPGFPRHFAIKGDLAYAATSDQGLQIIDISDLDHPRIISVCDVAGSLQDIEVTGDLAYVVELDHGLRVIDISDPYSPRVIGSFTPPDMTWILGIRVSGHYAYLGDARKGLYVVDVSDATNPVYVTRRPTDEPDVGAYTIGLELIDKTVYVLSGLVPVSFDISDPANPVRSARSAPVRADGVAQAPLNLLFVGNEQDFSVVDMNPQTPRVVASDPNPVGSIAAEGEYLLAAGLEHLTVFKFGVQSELNTVLGPTGSVNAGERVTLIWARNAFGAPVWSLALGSADGSSLPIPISPIQLADGKWLAQAQIPATATAGCDYTFTIADEFTGTSARFSPFCITDIPRLRISRQNPHTLLQWNVSPNFFRLEVTDAINGVWQTIPLSELSLDQSVFSYRTYGEESRRFYRLRKE